MTSASMGGAFKAYLEAQGLGVAWYRDGAPPDTPPPYGVVLEGVGYGEPGQAGAVLTELVQVDLYQPARRTLVSGRVAAVEDYRLPETVAALLQGRGIEFFSPWHVYGSRAAGRRWPPADNLVRHTWTVAVTRSTQRKAA